MNKIQILSIIDKTKCRVLAPLYILRVHYTNLERHILLQNISKNCHKRKPKNNEKKIRIKKRKIQSKT